MNEGEHFEHDRLVASLAKQRLHGDDGCEREKEGGSGRRISGGELEIIQQEPSPPPSSAISGSE